MPNESLAKGEDVALAQRNSSILSETLGSNSTCNCACNCNTINHNSADNTKNNENMALRYKCSIWKGLR